MKYVLDASVAVAAVRTMEPHHDEALERCLPLFARRDEIVVPAIFDVEVISALVRRGISLARVEQFLRTHLAARRLVTIGPRASRAAARIAATTRLRAADALYVWVAVRERLDLVSLDVDVLSRAGLVGVTALAP